VRLEYVATLGFVVKPRWGKDIGKIIDLIDFLLFACQQIHSIPKPVITVSIANFRHPSFALPDFGSAGDLPSLFSGWLFSGSGETDPDEESGGESHTDQDPGPVSGTGHFEAPAVVVESHEISFAR